LQPKSRNDRGSRFPAEPLQDDAPAWPFPSQGDDLVTRVVGAHDDAPTPIARAHDDVPTRVVDASERPVDEDARTAVYRPKSQPPTRSGLDERESPWPTKDEIPTARSTPRSQKVTQRQLPTRLAPGLPRFAIIGVIVGFGVLGAVVTTWLVHRTSRMTVLVRDESGDRRSAGVFVDGSRRCDFSPCVLEEPAGDHIVTVAVEGAAPMIQSATFRAGDESTMTFVLPAIATAAATASPPTASASTPPSPAASVATTAATPAARPATAATPVTAPRKSASSGAACKLQFNSMPVADLNLDGVAIGETPRMNVSAPPGDHRVTFDAGDMKKTVVFRCGDGEDKTIAVRLP
jgi:hypothetical protein